MCQPNARAVVGANVSLLSDGKKRLYFTTNICFRFSDWKGNIWLSEYSEFLKLEGGAFQQKYLWYSSSCCLRQWDVSEQRCVSVPPLAVGKSQLSGKNIRIEQLYNDSFIKYCTRPHWVQIFEPLRAFCWSNTLRIRVLGCQSLWTSHWYQVMNLGADARCAMPAVAQRKPVPCYLFSEFSPRK